MSVLGTWSLEGTLFDDASVRKKLEVMSKWEAFVDDARNPDAEIEEAVSDLMQPGKRYKMTFVLEEMEDAR